MTKKIISLLLVLVLSISIIVPAFAAQTGSYIKLEDKSSSNSYYANYGKVYDASTNNSVKFSYTVPDNGVTVLLFYGANDSYNTKLFKELNALTWAKSEKVNFIAIESSKASASVASTFISNNASSGFIDKAYYDKDDQQLLMWYYTYIKNNGSMDGTISFSIAYCYALFITKENSKYYLRYSMDAVNSASQIANVLSKLMDTSALATGYSGYLNSGNTAQSKLSKPQIAKLLNDNPQTTPATTAGYFDTAPVVSGSYATGKVKTAFLQAATNRLSALRKIAGLPGVTMDTTMNTQAQYGAVLLAASNFDHYPAQPSDMNDDFYTEGKKATSTSNIAAGRHLTATPDGFMKDEGTNNLPTMGHRRWQLNPTMAKVGFGFAVNESSAYVRYAVEKAHDDSGPNIDYRFISWPASGSFPKEIFEYDTAWSVTLNPAYYQTPDINSVKVTLRASDGKEWTFSKNETYAVALYGKYFTVETNGYGVPNCIIFRPDGINNSDIDGTYTVVISGLKDTFGNSVSLSYKVDFFSYGEYLEMKNGWYTENGKTYYYKDGVMLTDWQNISNAAGQTFRFYFGKDGVRRTGWQTIGGKKYYFKSNGVMLKGWQDIKNTKGESFRFWFGSDGVMRTGWQDIKNSKGQTFRFFFRSNGVMCKGWTDIKNSKGQTFRFFFKSNGVMLKGWQDIKNAQGKSFRFYFGTNGVMRTGWQTIKNSKGQAYKYYFRTNGVMVTGNYKIGNKTYKFNSNGVCLNP